MGQHIMISKKWLNVMADQLEITPDDIVIELGAGTGNLSAELLKRRPKKLVLVEKDPEMIHRLRERFSDDSRVEILEEDIKRIFPLQGYDKIASNPPYLLSSFLIIGLVKSEFKRAVITFQKEFADRLLAEPGTPNYGSLSVISSLCFKMRKVAIVGRSSFIPPPKVDSALLVIEPRDIPHSHKELLIKYSKLIFSRRKRTLRKILSPILHDMADKAPYSNRRPYHLRPEEVLEVASWLEEVLPK